ncbi:hypothetical protein B0H19DRAFT_1074425 [Mycena capillaripes]|nr:hypothetical protein B0H19DRAFT_1074425 [Mycena capillaripes]
MAVQDSAVPPVVPEVPYERADLKGQKSELVKMVTRPADKWLGPDVYSSESTTIKRFWVVLLDQEYGFTKLQHCQSEQFCWIKLLIQDAYGPVRVSYQDPEDTDYWTPFVKVTVDALKEEARTSPQFIWLKEQRKSTAGYQELMNNQRKVQPNLGVVKSWKFIADFCDTHVGQISHGVQEDKKEEHLQSTCVGFNRRF